MKHFFDMSFREMKVKALKLQSIREKLNKKDRKIISSQLKDSIFFVHRVFSFLV